ncbi:hypothetical protein NUH86_21145 [Sphingobium sp. JS3065]|uniref:hypothetical protein n=1 Tax=Sphingobium sp. JS3065 TaxID=2970925 RepID=UPI002264D36E|nr:hypothetical protein [Sphingobium sp. JS3065]UZW57229.1 hypothetical protein NUH86_21145 [Sphingobium sp. JS3065]
MADDLSAREDFPLPDRTDATQHFRVRQEIERTDLVGIPPSSPVSGRVRQECAHPTIGVMAVIMLVTHRKLSFRGHVLGSEKGWIVRALEETGRTPG